MAAALGDRPVHREGEKRLRLLAPVAVLFCCYAVVAVLCPLALYARLREDKSVSLVCFTDTSVVFYLYVLCIVYAVHICYF